MTDPRHMSLTRRTVCSGLTGAAVLGPWPRAQAQVITQDFSGRTDEAIREMFGTGQLREDRVTLTMPPIAENGFSVPVAVEVDSPMTAEDYVRRIAVFAERNPIPTLIQYHLGPRAGRAHVATRLRLAGSQTLRAVAETSDGALWIGYGEVVVTLAACVVL